ncbi:cytochrome P450 2C23-like [Platysternon megacephalum]|uniref:Cytochrome P450 2C23-like n=1 Tax=Platysternon megacephalum TaxID=55544 RepID=A0A4D9DS64_9SAUR|nr:cytochrome P450 2C23-like [Platysternon megacephalum]
MAAAGGGGPVRLRLLFDYPPPGSPGCSLCWLLLEPSQVRLVTDLISLIREKFGFSRRAQLRLFLDGALLPPTESARLVRDNDSLRVKLEEVVADSCDETGNGITYSSRKERKRHRQKLDEEGESKSEDDRHRRNKKKKKQNSEHLSYKEEDSVNVQDSWKKSKKRKRKEEVNGRNGISGGKDGSGLDESKKLKKKSEGEKELETERKDAKQRKTRAVKGKTVLEKANNSFLLSPSKSSTVKNIAAQSSKKRGGISDCDSSSTSSDSEMDMKQNKSSHKSVAATLHRDKAQLAANSAIKAVAASKVTAKSKDENSPKTAISKKAKPQSSSSDSDSSMEEEQSSNSKRNLLPKNPPIVNIMSKSPKAKTSSSKSDCSDSETFVIKKPIANVGFNKSLVKNGDKQLPTSNQGPAVNPSSFGRGLGRGEDNFFWRGHRGRGCRGMIRGRGRGRSRGESNSVFFNYSSESQKQQQLNEAAKNTSVVIQNPVEVPKKDYSVLPLLAAPPQVGGKIAFKLLELTENYTPEVSDYKEGKIISWNADNKQLELEILSSSAVVKEPGKFDLVYESADGAEVIEYAVSQDTKITESWGALIEPRLIVEPPPTNESTTENVKL